MQIKKSAPLQDARSQLISRAFDHAIIKVDFPWRFDCLEFHIRDESKVFTDGGRCVIVFNYDNEFAKKMDEKGILAGIYRLLFLAVSRQKRGQLPSFIEEIASNRDMIKGGLGDFLTYYYFNLPQKSGLDSNIAWLSFFLHEKYDSEFFKKQADPKIMKQYKKLIEILMSDLDRNGTADHAARVYKETARSSGEIL
jgi:hypothetical protein